MNSVSVANLPVGSYIDKPVYLDEKFVLLSPDIPITEELQKRLQIWSYSKVYTDGTPVESPPEYAPALSSEGDSGNGSAAKAALDIDYKEKEYMDEVQRFFHSMTAFLSEVFELYLKHNSFQMNRISEQVKACTDMIKSRRKYLTQINLLQDSEHSYLISHSVKTTIIALVFADVLKLPPFKQIEVGMAGLLHEIGMLRIPPQLYMSSKQLSQEEKKTIAAHTVLGFRILKAAEFPLSVSRAVLESHERVDGSGYPRGLTGDKISFYAKILTISSSYSAIVSKRPYRDAADGHTGIMDLLKNTGKQYDEQLIRVLVYTLSIYPVGTYVALSNGAQGLVIETDSEKPKYPIVKLLLNEQGAPFREQPILHTEEGGGIQIVRPLIQQEITNISAVINR
jgi:HD-GYP domain-containing protein (c-di-GMP phosphodiesterase class II)